MESPGRSLHSGLLMRRWWSAAFLAAAVGCVDGDVRNGEPQGRAGEVGEAVSETDELRVPDSLVPPDSGNSSEALPADPDLGPGSQGNATADAGAEGPTGEPGSEDTPETAQSGFSFSKPDSVKGIYLNAWAAGSSRRRRALISLAERTEVNAFVIDIKDATGFISHSTNVPLAREVGATGEIRIRDLDGVLAQLHEAGIYPIARIVVSKDPLVSEVRPDLAIQDSAGGVWLDQDGVRWLNLHHPDVWKYHVDIAREVVKAGFPEVQWDYVRFPDAPQALRDRQVFPESEGRPMTQAVRSFLSYSNEELSALGAAVTADVFGVTTSYRRDVGIGQVWEQFIDKVDVALPMVYPSHYWTGSFGYDKPNAHPYEVVRRAMRDAVSRSAEVEGAGAVRPWLQDFSLGDPPYDAPEVRAQIQATYDAGLTGWILWNPGSRYTESALLPRSGLPSWLEPFMRVGGEVVPLSKRFEILGESPPESDTVEVDTFPVPDLALPSQPTATGSRTLPAVPIPDTGRVVPPDTGAVGGSGGEGIR